MTWRQLQRAGRVQTHATSKRELDDLRTVIEWDEFDEQVEAWIADNHPGLAS